MTTTAGIVCKDGIVLASDHQASSGYYVAHKHAKKIHKITDNIGMTIAGTVADAQSIIDIMIAECNLYKLDHEQEISVEAAANLLSNILYGQRIYPYMLQTIIGGEDKSGNNMYTLDPLGSLIKEETVATTGSGTPMAISILEDNYKEEMTINEAIPIAIHAVRASIERDVASGYGIDVIIINKDGYKKISESEVTEVLKQSGKELA
ncbi:MAG: archaeal proteasome endopeptidase complex subunit beta [Candidatus Lokiarchaeota archaeon]|nr:archaeal proteasome endopeptidase complex subunit beta [Candidatus Lokiarchaeota archaeon]